MAALSKGHDGKVAVFEVNRHAQGREAVFGERRGARWVRCKEAFRGIPVAERAGVVKIGKSAGF